ncbi:MAG: FecR family protein [Myxococcota bacterium]|nr:FecR family protein [Myxococcota bacterium]
MNTSARPLLLGLSFLLATPALASWEAKMGPVSGGVQTQAPRGAAKPASEGRSLAVGERIQTSPQGRATVIFDDGATVELASDTELVLTAPPKKKGIPPVRFSLSGGEVTVRAQSVSGAFVVRVPAGSVWLFSARVRIGVDGSEVRASALEGRVEVATVGRAAKLQAGQGVVAQKGSAPGKPFTVAPEASSAAAAAPPARKEKTPAPDLGGFGLDLTETPAAEEKETAEEEVAPPPASEPQPEPVVETKTPPTPMSLKFRLGGVAAPGLMLGLPNTFAGGTLRVRGDLVLFPWLELGLSLGFGEWARVGELVPNRPAYSVLATLEAELAVRVPFGAPFAELGVGYRGFTVEEASRGYLDETGPLALTVGGGYSLHVGLPVDVMLRLGAIPGTRTSFLTEIHAIVWAF